MFKRLIVLILIVSFILSYYQPVYAQPASPIGGDFSINQLPIPGTMVGKSVPFTPLALKGIVVNPQKPLEFQFIVDTGDSFTKSMSSSNANHHTMSSPNANHHAMSSPNANHHTMSSPNALIGDPQQEQLKTQANQLVKYFLAGLTIPEGDLWVNLSPYEKNRMVPEALGQTDLGRDLLAQDYILKQLTASLIYPEKDLGKAFWNRVYSKAQQQFGTTNVPVNTFNKVWILPDQAQVFEHGAAAYVTKATLKVMLDEDYLALSHQVISNSFNVIPAKAGIHKKNNINTLNALPLAARNDVASIGANIIRQIILPEITKEVNHGRNFAPLRQIYQALILAKWYKETIQNSLLDAVYTNKNKIAGVNLNDPAVKEQIYNRYLQAYKKGAFNYIKEGPTPDGQVLPRKYFSGGISRIEPAMVATDGAMSDVLADGPEAVINISFKMPDAAKTGGTDEAMKSEKALMQIDLKKAQLPKQDALYVELLFRSTKLIEDTLKAVYQVTFRKDEIKNVYVHLYSEEGDNRVVYKVSVDVFGRTFNFIMKITRFDDKGAMDHVVMTALTNPRLNRPDGFIAKMPDGRLITTGPYYPGVNAKTALRGGYIYRVIMSVAEEASRIWFRLGKRFIYEPHGGQFVVDQNFYTFGATLIDRGHFRILSSLDARLISDDPQNTLRVEAQADSTNLETWIVEMPDDHFLFTLIDHLRLGEGNHRIKTLNMYAIAEGMRSGLGKENAREFLKTFKASSYRQEDPLRKEFIQAAEFVFALPAEIGPSVLTPFPVSLKGFYPLPSVTAESRPLVLLALEQFDTDNKMTLNDLMLNLFREVNDSELQEAVIQAVVHIFHREGKVVDETKIKKFMERQWYSFIPIPLNKILTQVSQAMKVSDVDHTIPEVRGEKSWDGAMSVRKKLLNVANTSIPGLELAIFEAKTEGELEEILKQIIASGLSRNIKGNLMSLANEQLKRLPDEPRKKENPSRDEAMTIADQKKLTSTGGIDLNRIKVKRTGKTINVRFDQAQLNELEQRDFKGFIPEITGFRYIKSPFSLLGINTPAKEPVVLAKV